MSNNFNFNHWMDQKWWKVGVILLALAYGFWHPGVRQIIIFILPLGREWDDILIGVPLIFAGVIFLFRLFKRRSV